MTLSELADLGEIFGGLAVVVSIGYLIFEVRKNTQAARNESAWRATTSMADITQEIANSPELAQLCMRGLDPDLDPNEFSSSEFAQLFFVCRTIFFRYEAQWHLWKDGGLSDAIWDTRRTFLRSFISLPVPSRIWDLERESNQYSADFFAAIDFERESVARVGNN